MKTKLGWVELSGVTKRNTLVEKARRQLKPESASG
jgi:hypothetical protein